MSASVLYVDDDRSLCQIVAKALAGEGYSVRTCHDGAEALAILDEYLPDLLLVDLMLLSSMRPSVSSCNWRYPWPASTRNGGSRKRGARQLLKYRSGSRISWVVLGCRRNARFTSR
jgi:hypothetical protein